MTEEQRKDGNLSEFIVDSYRAMHGGFQEDAQCQTCRHWFFLCMASSFCPIWSARACKQAARLVVPVTSAEDVAAAVHGKEDDYRKWQQLLRRAAPRELAVALVSFAVGVTFLVLVCSWDVNQGSDDYIGLAGIFFGLFLASCSGGAFIISLIRLKDVYWFDSENVRVNLNGHHDKWKVSGRHGRTSHLGQYGSDWACQWPSSYDVLLAVLEEYRGVSTFCDGNLRPMRAVLEEYVSEDAAAEGLAEGNRFEANVLITGRPENAALGVNEYMLQTDEYVWAGMARGVPAIVEEFEKNGTAEDRECLDYVLNQLAGSSELKFQWKKLRRDIFYKREPDGRHGQPLSYFVNHPNSLKARLKISHVLALRVYTTAAYASLNNPLRNIGPFAGKPHPFAVTVALIADAIRRLRAVGAEGPSADKLHTDLWRGMRNLTVTDQFLERGGTELAPMSTTADLSVALDYSARAPTRLLMKLRASSFMDRGADLSYLSAFPDEVETLYPPLTFLKPTGKQQTMEIRGVKFIVIEVAPFV